MTFFSLIKPKKGFISLFPPEGTMKYKLAVLLVLLFSTVRIFAQNGIVHGTVVNENQEGMGNVTVTAEPGGLSVTTDASGKFIFTGLPKGRIKITATFIGFEDASDDVENESGNDRLIIFLAMRPKVNSSKEIVIIGYARQIKKDVIGNISKIRAAELTVNPGLSFDASLQGKAPGIQVIQSGGIAGAGALIRIRGIASVSASGEPLYVVDGLPINQDQFINIGNGVSGQQNNPLSILNISDIESVEILKDAAAAGIYGSRGANGVIYITTKRQAFKAPNKLTFTSSVGTSSPTVKLPMLDNKSWLDLYQEAWLNDGNSGQAKLPDDIQWADALATNTNWAKEVTRLGIKTETNASYAFSAGNWRLFNSFGYLNAGSYIKDNNFRRYGGRVNGDLDVSNKTHFKFGVMLSDSRNNRQSQSVQGGLGAAYSYALPIFAKDRVSGFGAYGNPLLRMKYQHWHTDENRLMANTSLETEILRNLVWELKGAYDYMDVYDNLYIEKEFQAKDGIPQAQQKSYSQLSNYKANNKLLNTNFVYYIRRSSKTDLNILFGGEYQRADIKTWQYTQDGINRELTPVDYNPNKIKNNTEAWSFLSSFVRFNGRINAKWLMQGSYRIDGSSRFGTNNRFGQFPSLALGYLMSEEKWLKESKNVNFLKIRAGWGYIGSSAIPNFIQYGTFGNPTNNNTYNGQQILQPYNIANPDLRWEMCRVSDAGIEISLFKNRLYMEISAYDRQTKDVLLDARIPGSTGAINSNSQFRYFENVGTVINRGAELLFNAVIIDKQKDGKRFAWQFKGNFMHNQNKVINMGFLDPDAIVGGGETRIMENQPIGVFYLVRYSHVDKATGKPVYLDKNGNETFQYSLDNRVISGNVQPKLIAFAENRFDVQRWGFSFSFYGVYGGKIYDEGAKYQFTMLSRGNVQEGLEDRWQKPGDDATYAKLSLNPLNYGGLDNIANYHTTQWLYDASYIRLREVSVKYKIKEDRGGAGKIKTATVLLSAFNLWLFTKYPGDPEVIRDYSVSAQRNIGTNVTNLSPPQERSIMLTLKLEI